jgi:threonine dehydratase
MNWWRAAIEAAEARIRPYILETPAEPSDILGGPGGATVHLKLENLQRTGSFKLRGAMNKLLSLRPEEMQRGIVAASSGNHGAAVAWGLRALGMRGIIFVPENASPAKVAAIKERGAEVRSYGTDSGVTEVFARKYAAENRLVYVSPYNDEAVVAGQGTLGLELAWHVRRIDAVFVALGGGGLIGGIGACLKGAGREVEMVACSPENSAVMHHSLEAGTILEMESRPTLSDGTAGAVEKGAITFDLCRQVVDRRILVTEEEIREALRLIVGRHHTLIEGAAAVAVAGFLKERERYRGRHVVIVLCGANIALETLLSSLGGGNA